MKKLFKISVSSFAAVLIVISVFIYFKHSEYYPSTDDAYVQANVIQVAAEVSGRVTEIFVKDHQAIKKGDLLFQIDTKPFELALQKAQAQLKENQQTMQAQTEAVKSAEAVVAQRQAEFTNAQKNYDRTMTLVRKRLMAVAAGDDADSKLKETKAALQAAQSELAKAEKTLGDSGEQNAAIQEAKAAVAQAELDLSHTQIYANADGTIANFSLRVGDVVNANQNIFSIVENTEWWVSASFKETQLKRIREGQTAEISLDMYPDIIFKGKVESISRGSDSAFSLFPAENATGNWVKVTQRIPVKILIIDADPNYPLRVGASSRVVVDTKHLK